MLYDSFVTAGRSSNVIYLACRPNMRAMGGDFRFWFLFGGLWLLVGMAFLVTSLGAMLFAPPSSSNEAPSLWLFTAIGAAAAAAGGAIIYMTRVTKARDSRLMETGYEVMATVTKIRQSLIKINRQPRYHVAYRYEGNTGQLFTGESRAMSAESVERYRPGDRVAIKVDAQRPEESLFFGAM